MNINIPYAEMMTPLQGPENPFGDRNRFMVQNALAGHVEEQDMTEHAFRAQHQTFSILGYASNPSIDPRASAVVGSTDVALENRFASLDTMRATKAQKKDLKRKRDPKGDLDIVEGEGAYAGPWASWEDDRPQPLLNEGDDDDESSEEEDTAAVPMTKSRQRRLARAEEHSVFHGKSVTDYQGRTYMHPPLAEAPHLSSESGSQESFIPKVCIHTWTGHTQGVSVIRAFPETGHLLLSGSMDTKIKVCYFPHHVNFIHRVASN
jgi:pre-mRNA-processing factor 17